MLPSEGAATPQLTVAIQAGGESRRMGRSKATVPFCGRPLMCRLVERLAPIADELLIISNEPENLGFLRQMPAWPKIRLERDLIDERGALTGLLTALSLASHDFVAVCACDMYNASPEVFSAELARLVSEGRDVVVPVSGKGFEPFHGVYRRATCLGVVKECMRRASQGESPATRKGGGSMKSVLSDPGLNVGHFTMDDIHAVAPYGGCLANCNTPEELASAERHVLGASQ